jgi:hypothetical protein
MPYLHLDFPIAVQFDDRARIAGRLARVYAEVMETSPRRPTVGFRELGEHGVLRLGADSRSTRATSSGAPTASARTGNPARRSDARARLTAGRRRGMLCA